MAKINTKNKRFTRIEINLSNLASNIRQLRTMTGSPKTKIMAVVKSNAYGHGMVEVSKQAVKSGANTLGVALAEDAIKLRKAGIKVPVYILGEPPMEIVKDSIKYDFVLCLNSYRKAKLISDMCERFGKKIAIHLKIDTGMNRVGINFKNAIEEIKMIRELEGLKIDGIFTHFSCAGEPDEKYTLMQWERFQNVLAELESLNIRIPTVHCANSAAFLRHRDFHCDMVRLGISIYGLSPFGVNAEPWLGNEIKENLKKLKPVLCLKSKVSFIKNVAKGESISYCATFKTSRPSVIATIPIGYADGYSRLLSNKSSVLINGGFAPVVGNVTMDSLMVDVTDIQDNASIKEGTEVILIGTGMATNSEVPANTINPENKIGADILAGLIGTINYEILCMLKDKIPRVYIY